MTEQTKTEKFLARNPTKIGVMAGVTFYEHPHYGDEFPMMAVTSDGRLVKSHFYEFGSDITPEYALSL